MDYYFFNGCASRISFSRKGPEFRELPMYLWGFQARGVALLGHVDGGHVCGAFHVKGSSLETHVIRP